MAASGKTYKLEQETQDKLQSICEETGLTWDATFRTLADLYAQQKAAEALPGRKTEITEVQSLLKRLSEAFTHSWEINADTDERIRMEYSQRMATQEEAINSLNEKTAAAEAAAKMAKDDLGVANKELESLRKQNVDLQTELDRTQSAATEAAKASAEALADKVKLNEYMQQQMAGMKEKVDSVAELESQISAMKEELSTAADKRKSLSDDLERANREIEDLKAKLDEQKDKMTELKGRYDERMDLAAQKAANDLRDAVLKEREASAAKLDALREKYASEILHTENNQDKE